MNYTTDETKSPFVNLIAEIINMAFVRQPNSRNVVPDHRYINRHSREHLTNSITFYREQIEEYCSASKLEITNRSREELFDMCNHLASLLIARTYLAANREGPLSEIETLDTLYHFIINNDSLPYRHGWIHTLAQMVIDLITRTLPELDDKTLVFCVSLATAHNTPVTGYPYWCDMSVETVNHVTNQIDDYKLKLLVAAVTRLVDEVIHNNQSTG